MRWLGAILVGALAGLAFGAIAIAFLRVAYAVARVLRP